MIQAMIKMPDTTRFSELTEDELISIASTDANWTPDVCSGTRFHTGLKIIDIITNDILLNTLLPPEAPNHLALPTGWEIIFLAKKIKPVPIYTNEEIIGYTPEWEVLIELPLDYIEFLSDVDDNNTRPTEITEPHRFYGHPKRF